MKDRGKRNDYENYMSLSKIRDYILSYATANFELLEAKGGVVYNE